MREIGVSLVVRVRFVFQNPGVEPKGTPVQIGLQWLGAADFGQAFRVQGDGPNDTCVAGMEGVRDVG